MEGIHVSLAPEVLGTFLGIPITNTLITSWAVILILTVIAFRVGSRISLIPSKIQTLFEWIIEYVYDYVAETLESKKLAKKFFPFLMTIFLFIFTANLLEFTPGIGSIGFFEDAAHVESIENDHPISAADHGETQFVESLGPNGEIIDIPVSAAESGHVAAEVEKEHGTFLPLLRSVNTDLNVTLALAIIAFIVIEITGFATIGTLKYIGKFIDFKNGAIGFAVGLVELIGEFARLISLSFRLFGNILAGEVLIVVALFFAPYFGPVPLMMFEVFIGFLQAAVFALLTLFFIKLAITEPHGAEAH